MNPVSRYKSIIPRFAILILLALVSTNAEAARRPPGRGMASWYGEDHRGRLMANGKRFDPDKLTAASWFYPLGTRVRVTVKNPRSSPKPERSVTVTITDRGPARDLVRDGRIIDLSHGTFRKLADPELGLVEVMLTPLPKRSG